MHPVEMQVAIYRSLPDFVGLNVALPKENHQGELAAQFRGGLKRCCLHTSCNAQVLKSAHQAKTAHRAVSTAHQVR